MKEKGEELLAGSLNIQRGVTQEALRVKVTREANESTVAQLVRLVERGQSGSRPADDPLEKILSVFVPSVIGLSG